MEKVNVEITKFFLKCLVVLKDNVLRGDGNTFSKREPHVIPQDSQEHHSLKFNSKIVSSCKRKLNAVVTTIH